MLIASLFAFFVAAFLLSTITVAIVWMAFLKQRREETEAARGEGGEPEYAPPETMEASGLFHDERLSTVSFWANLLSRFDFVEILKVRIAQAGRDWSVGRITLAMLLLGTVVLLVMERFSPLIALFAAIGAASLPYAYIMRLRAKRFETFREGFPDLLDSLARALRAGYSLSIAMDSVTNETNKVVAQEIRKTSGEANFGMGWPRALENLGKRMPLLEVNLFTSAVVLHSRTGGHLGEVISGLSENMRETSSLRGEVRALAAHGKLTGVILTVLPLAIAAMMFVVSPDYMMVLFRNPTGANLVMISIGSLILAHFVIKKIVDIEI